MLERADKLHEKFNALINTEYKALSVAAVSAALVIVASASAAGDLADDAFASTGLKILLGIGFAAATAGSFSQYKRLSKDQTSPQTELSISPDRSP